MQIKTSTYAQFTLPILLLNIFASCMNPPVSMEIIASNTADEPSQNAFLEDDHDPALVQTPSPKNNINIAASEPLMELSPDNISKIEIKERYSPFYPPIIAISGNQKTIAAADLTGIHIYDSETQEKLLSIDDRLPDCRFGWDNYLTLDHSGEYLAFATNTGLEVWQVAGGRIYQSLYEHGQELDPLTCGLDIPQFALSPGGQYLAESGFGVSGEEYGDYFRIIDILTNTVVYQWDGKPTSFHGQLQTFPELGFSPDGKLLHTFDPLMYQERSQFYKSFKFWNSGDWQVATPGSQIHSQSTDQGDLYFSISDKHQIEVINKLTGDVIITVESEGCTRELPCPVVFSPDGTKFGVMKQRKGIQYKREVLFSEVEIYAMATGARLSTKNLLARNKSSVVLKNNGEIVTLQFPNTNEARWWSQTAYLNGFFITKGENVGFTPQVWDVFNYDHNYSGTCILTLENKNINCNKGIIQSEDDFITLEQITNGFILLQNEDPIAQVKYPEGDGKDQWQIRLMAYNKRTGVGYFCLDRNLREETCVVMNFPENKIIFEQIDLFGFNHSDESDTSVFIDREQKELNIFSENSGRRVQMHSYQAIAFLLKPAIMEDGVRSFYIVQNVENEDLYIEEINLVAAKVIKRYTFDILNEIKPIAMAVNHQGNLLVVSDDDGNIHFLDLVKNEMIYTKNISPSNVIDMIFSLDDTSLVVMDETGEISVLKIME